MRYLERIEIGLPIEKPEIFLPWNITQSECLTMCGEFQKVRDNHYSFKAELRDIPFVKSLGLQFDKEILSKILLFNEHEFNEKNLMVAFLERQIILEQNFGKPLGQNAVANFFTKVNEGDKEYKWRFKHVTIAHKIWDRFGFEEHIEICIKK